MKIRSAFLIAALIAFHALYAQWDSVPQGEAVWTSNDRNAPIDSVITVHTDSTFMITAVVDGEVHSEVWRRNRNHRWKHEGKKTDGAFYVDFSNHRMLVSPFGESSMTYVYYADLRRP